MTRTQTRGKSKFILHVETGSFTDSEIIVLLGENGTGKSRLRITIQIQIHGGDLLWVADS